MSDDTTSRERWRGLARLAHDAVVNGVTVIERMHRETAERPFAILEAIPAIAPVARSVRAIHDAAGAGVYQTIRGVAGALAATVDALLAERPPPPPPSGP